jgi:sortase A
VIRATGHPSAGPESGSTPGRSFASVPAWSLFRRGRRRGGPGAALRIEAVLWTLALACAVVVGAVVVDRSAFQLRAGSALAAPAGQSSSVSPGSGSDHSAPTATPQATRPFVARLEIPGLGLSALVVDGVDETTLRRAVGRIPASSRPGEPGDVALAGHRDTDFRALEGLRRGDLLRLRTAEGPYEYRVESIRVARPTRVDLLAPEGHPTLTLITCYPFRYVGAAPLRYLVRAREVSRPAAPASQSAAGGTIPQRS